MENKYTIFDFDLSKIVSKKVFFNNIKEANDALISDTVFPELKSSLKINEEKGHYIVLFGIVVYLNEDKEIKLIDIDYTYQFELKKDIKLNKEKFSNVDFNLIKSLIAVSYSTFRGNFFERMNASPFNNFSPLPIIDASNIAKHQYNFDKEDLLTNEEEEE